MMLTIAENAIQGMKPLTDPLAIYLNDHLAGATAGVELFRRTTAGPQGKHRDALQRLTREVEDDRAALIDIMGLLDVPVRRYKVAAGWLTEKVGRFKPNGRLVGRSPLSSLLEMEALGLGVRGKAVGWRALRVVAAHDTRLAEGKLDELIARADRQSDELEKIRQEIATEVFAGG
jgi:hypothetical protein